MTYKGKYKVKNIAKYKSNHKEVVYRSSWERAVFRFLDGNDGVSEWSSEEYVIPYRCSTDKRVHRYFVDIYFKDSQGQKWLVEIKPKKQTVPPPKPKRKEAHKLNKHCLPRSPGIGFEVSQFPAGIPRRSFQR